MYTSCLEVNRKAESKINRMMKLAFGEDRIKLVERDEMVQISTEEKKKWHMKEVKSVMKESGVVGSQGMVTLVGELREALKQESRLTMLVGESNWFRGTLINLAV